MAEKLDISEPFSRVLLLFMAWTNLAVGVWVLLETETIVPKFYEHDHPHGDGSIYIGLSFALFTCAWLVKVVKQLAGKRP